MCRTQRRGPTRIIITGGTGLLGQALARELVSTESQNQVIVLSRTPERAKHLVAGVSLQRWDARSAEGWGSLAKDADAIVNLAGQSLLGRWTPRRKRRILESRVNARCPGEQLVTVWKTETFP